MAVIDIFNEKRKCCNYRCPDSVYFHMLLLIIYMSAIETPICRIEMSVTRSTFFGQFAQNTIHDFQNTVLNSISPISVPITNNSIFDFESSRMQIS